ncbi:hypothetical protein [Cupriavidus sp. amp6]|uniref:hypothetical protein n=1 Tax=Cupriavidus sp. amp6 TaxID=388051 RepID=UPI0012ECAD0B|nr:hypothetical protein [Cupriavidus sp. amp6]
MENGHCQANPGWKCGYLLQDEILDPSEVLISLIEDTLETIIMWDEETLDPITARGRKSIRFDFDKVSFLIDPDGRILIPSNSNRWNSLDDFIESIRRVFKLQFQIQIADMEARECQEREKRKERREHQKRKARSGECKS